jgi:hypothetical protein
MSHSNLNSPAISSKISAFKEYLFVLLRKFNQSQKKFYNNSAHNHSLSVHLFYYTENTSYQSKSE